MRAVLGTLARQSSWCALIVGFDRQSSLATLTSMAEGPEAVPATSNIATEPEHDDLNTEHPRSGPHAGENGIVSPHPAAATPAASHDAANGHMPGNASAHESDREDAGMSHASTPADKVDATRGPLIPEPWKKR